MKVTSFPVVALFVVVLCASLPSPEKLFAAQDAPDKVTDAEFSPDGKWIAVSTLQEIRLYEREGLKIAFTLFQKELDYRIDWEGNESVCYLKWSPDSKRILLSAWEFGNCQTTYHSILDVEQRKILFYFAEPLRWYTSDTMYVEPDSPPSYFLTAFFTPDFFGTSPGQSMAFSPDGKKLSYLRDDNRIVTISAENGSMLVCTEPPEETLITLGYVDEGKRIWAGTYSTPDTHEENRLMFFNSSSGLLVQKKELRKDKIPNPDYRFVRTLDVREDQRYALALSNCVQTNEGQRAHGELYLFDLSTGDCVQTLGAGRGNGNSQLRACFGGGDSILGVYDEHYAFVYDDSLVEKRISLPTFVRGRYARRPFSPDKKDLLLLHDEDRFTVYLGEKEEYKTMYLNPAGIGDFRQHENR